ncbi:MAG: hypothetical protein HOP19_02550 [Acidobacteria bacterium]|nr:hypothetical protein [Acidobacteriota bacterium]
MSEQKYGLAWLDTLHRENGWVPVRHGYINGWKKSDDPASGTRFPFAQCVNDLDEHTVEIYSDVCASYGDAVALVHITSDQLDDAEEKVRDIVVGKSTGTHSTQLMRFLLRCCHFASVFSAPPSEAAALGPFVPPGLEGTHEVWYADGSSTIQRRAQDMCLLLLKDARELFLTYLLSVLQETSDAWPTNGALTFLYRVLENGVISVGDVRDTLQHPNLQSDLPYGSRRLHDMCLELLRKLE